jgi:hypothetical protein
MLVRMYNESARRVYGLEKGGLVALGGRGVGTAVEGKKIGSKISVNRLTREP